MAKFLLQRFFQALLSLLAITVLLFIVVRLTGDPTLVLLPEDATVEQYNQLKHNLGLDKPIYTQYFIYMGDLLTGNLGKSIISRSQVTDLLLERLPATLQLGGIAMVIAFSIAIPMGIYAAAYVNRPLDWFARGQAIFFQSVPSFWFAILMIQVFAVWLGWLPAGGRGEWKQIVLPALVMGLGHAALVRLTRSAMLEVLSSDYVKLARVKGVSERLVLFRHAFRNAMIPVLTISGLLMVAMLTGVVIVETVFAWPGVGRLAVDAVRSRDFPVVQGVILIFAGLYITMNLLVDIAYAYVNPRIRY